MVRVESIGHEDPIKPHLVLVRGRAVPEATSWSARVAVQHSANCVGGGLVLFFASSLVPVKKVVANTVIVEAVVGLIEVRNDAIFSHDEAVDPRAIPVEQLIVARAGNDGFVARVERGATVPPVSLLLVVVDNPRLGHARGVSFGDAIGLVEGAAWSCGSAGGGGESQAMDDV